MDCELDNNVVLILNFLIWIIVLRSCHRMTLFLRKAHNKIKYTGGGGGEGNCILELEGLTFVIMFLAVGLLTLVPA